MGLDINNTPLCDLLLERGYTYDPKDKKGYKLAVFKDGKKLGYFSADEAHDKFVLLKDI